MARVLPVLLVVAAAGCGEGEPAGEGRLTIEKTRSGGPSYIEGSLTEVTVRDDDGKTVLEATQPQSGSARFVDRELPAGEYRLLARERPCHGNCSFLDPPASRCEAEVEIRRNRTTRAVVHFAGTLECYGD